MKPKVLSIILIFSLVLNLAVLGTYIFRKINLPSAADNARRFNPGGFIEDIGLNENQQKEMHTLMHEFRQMNRENRRAIFELEDELLKTIRGNDSDSTKINNLINKIGQLRIDQSKQAINHIRKFNRFLTPDQQEHFHRMIIERPERHGKRFRGWREGREKGRNLKRGPEADSIKNVK